MDRVDVRFVIFLQEWLNFLAFPWGYLGGVLAPFNNYSILIEIPLAASQKYDQGIALVATIDKANSTILRLWVMRLPMERKQP